MEQLNLESLRKIDGSYANQTRTAVTAFSKGLSRSKSNNRAKAKANAAKEEEDFKRRMNLPVTDPSNDAISIRDNLILTALNAVVQQIDNTVSVPKALEQNKYIWAKAMFKEKALQDIISSYTNQIQRYIRKELHDKVELEQFMKTTRQPDKSINSTKQFIDEMYAKIGSKLKLVFQARKPWWIEQM